MGTHPIFESDFDLSNRMPPKKRYNSRFPPVRIKKIMQSDEEIGKVAAAVPVLISRAIELFMVRLLRDAEKQIQQRNARTLTPQHIKQAIMSHECMSFLTGLVQNIPDNYQQPMNDNFSVKKENTSGDGRRKRPMNPPSASVSTSDPFSLEYEVAPVKREKTEFKTDFAN